MKNYDSDYKYEIIYNSNNLTAKARSDNSEETIVCSLYSSNQLRVQTFFNYFEDDSIEENGDYLYEFMAFEEIEKGISASMENSIYPQKRKKHWWNS